MAPSPLSFFETKVPRNEETRTSNNIVKQLRDIVRGKMEDPVIDTSSDIDGNDEGRLHDEAVEESRLHFIHESDTSISNNMDENPLESQERSGKGRSPIKVQFSGMEGPSPPSDLNLDEASRSELISKLGGLQERLTQTQVDLKQEKSKCRKKDKNIVKMAKELNQRQIDTTEKEEAIAKLNQLLADMGSKLQKASELEAQLRTTIDQYEKKLATVGIDVRTRHLLALERKAPPPLSSPKKMENMSLSETLDRVKGRPTTTKQRQRGKETTAHQKVRLGFSKRIILALSLCLVLIVVNLYQPEILSANGICAPVMPGTVLTGGDFSSSAPWWVTERMKVPTFQFFCGGRPRIHVNVESGRLALHKEHKGKMKTVQRLDATNTRINAATIVVDGMRGATKPIAAPWAR